MVWQKIQVSLVTDWLVAIAIFFLTSPKGSMALTAGSREYTKVGLGPSDPPEISADEKARGELAAVAEASYYSPSGYGP